MSRVYIAGEELKRGDVVAFVNGKVVKASSTGCQSGIATKDIPVGTQIDLDKSRPMLYEELQNL